VALSDIAAPALPHVHTRSCVQQPVGSMYQGAASSLAPQQLLEQGRKTLLTCTPGDGQPAEGATSEERTQWGGYLL